MILLASTEDEQRRASVRAWINESPFHAVAFATAEDAWKKSARAEVRDAPDADPAPADKASVYMPPRLSRRQMVGGFAVAASAVGVMTLNSLKPWLDRRNTGHGQRALARLEDGSVITLNGETTFDVDLQRKKRLIHMVRGEALFDIAPDRNRPFVIDLNGAQVRVLGTKFNIRKRDEFVEIAVMEGLVEASSNGKAIRLPAGYAASFRPGGRLAAIHAPHAVADSMAWYEGFMQFDNKPLSAVVSEFNRYRPKPIVIGDPRIESVMITGRFGLEESDAFISALESSFGIVALAANDGAVTLVGPQGETSLDRP